jgi:excinuclease ABC subunit C
LQQVFPLRKCNHVPHQKCLYYDIGQCLGPCVNKIQPEQYHKIKNEIDNFFSGKYKQIISDLKIKEKTAAEHYEFEEARKALDLINGIKEIEQHQNINLVSKINEDAVGYFIKDNLISISIISYVKGNLLTKNQQIGEFYGDINELLTNYLMQYYYQGFNLPKKCYVNLDPSNLQGLSTTLNIQFINPSRGKYQSILENTVKNASLYFQTNYLVYKQRKERTQLAFENFSRLLSLDNLSLIHVFDMSNLFGSDKVGAMIALDNGVFNKNLYRKFIIKDLKAASDTQYMFEVVHRQYKKMLEEKQPLPNLIIVDGGLGQVNAALKALKELNLHDIIPVIGLNKDRSHKTDGITFASKKIMKLDRKSDIYLFLFNIQEEVHRYAINFFRQRSKGSAFKSYLNEIEGLGEKTINKLLAHYDNIANIRQASIEELNQFVSLDIAKQIKAKI